MPTGAAFRKRSATHEVGAENRHRDHKQEDEKMREARMEYSCMSLKEQREEAVQRLYDQTGIDYSKAVCTWTIYLSLSGKLIYCTTGS